MRTNFFVPCTSSLVPRPSSSGFTLFYAVLVASLLLAVGLAIFNITYKELILSAGARESTAAFYAADAGLECALFWDRKHTGLSSPIFGFYGDSLASGIIGYWRFEEGTGDRAFDSSGRDNTGQLNGMDDSAWIFGGLAFDGSDDFVRLEEPVVFPQNSDFTISLWYKATNDGAPARMITGGGPGDNAGAGRKIGFLNSGGTSSFFVRIENGGTSDTSVPAITDGAWHHLAIRRHPVSNRVDLTIDGNKRNLFGNIGQEGQFQMYALGGDNPGVSTQMFLGSLDDVRAYNRALSDSEILKISQGASNISFTSPVAPNSQARCVGVDITNPSLGWETSTSTTAATTSFDISFPSGRCASIDVFKNTSTTTIVSRGYNTCDLTNPRRVERAIRAIY